MTNNIKYFKKSNKFAVRYKYFNFIFFKVLSNILSIFNSIIRNKHFVTIFKVILQFKPFIIDNITLVNIKSFKNLIYLFLQQHSFFRLNIIKIDLFLRLYNFKFILKTELFQVVFLFLAIYFKIC